MNEYKDPQVEQETFYPSEEWLVVTQDSSLLPQEPTKYNVCW